MSIETTLKTALDALCNNRCYADTAPVNTATPYITYSQVGGQVLNPIDGTPPGFHNARVQINVWHDSRLNANNLMRQVESLLRQAPYYAEPIGALIARIEEGVPQKGAQQDFSLWWS